MTRRPRPFSTHTRRRRVQLVLLLKRGREECPRVREYEKRTTNRLTSSLWPAGAPRDPGRGHFSTSATPFGSPARPGLPTEAWKPHVVGCSTFSCAVRHSRQFFTTTKLQSRQSMRQTLVEGRSDAANARVVHHWYRIQASCLASLQTRAILSTCSCADGVFGSRQSYAV